MKPIVLMLAAALILSSCSWFQDKYTPEQTAEELVAEGTNAFRNERYSSAIEAFTTLKDWYPFSKYAILAELKIADAHFEREEYSDAVIAYEEFEDLHPKNEDIPYVIYRIGMCWFNQIQTVDKDQTPAHKAIEEFNRLIKRSPDSPYAKRAEKRIETATQSIAGHEFYVGEFYMKANDYKAALKRFEYLFANYPDTEEGQKALSYINECRKHLTEE